MFTKISLYIKLKYINKKNKKKPYVLVYALDKEERQLLQFAKTIAKALNYHKENYQYKYTTIVAGIEEEYGADKNEAIIRNARVIYKIN